MPKFHSVSGALEYLDGFETSENIAAELLRRGVKSKPGCPESCAVADFVHEYAGVYSVAIDGESAFGYYAVNSDGEPEAWFKVLMPDSVQEFVTDFDHGRFPELISPAFRGANAHLYGVKAA